MDGVLCEVELAPLPERARKDGLVGGTEAGVIVAGDELDPAHSPPNEVVEECSPVNFGLGKGDGDAQNAASSFPRPIAEKSAASRTTPPTRIFS